jgi:AraC-like DNA-binding protein
MATAESYTRFVAARITPPPRTSGETLHWDGRSVASWERERMPVSVPVACAVAPVEGPLVSGDYSTPPGTMRQRGRIGVPPVPEITWGTETASMTVYLALEFLVAPMNAVIPRATGTLVWVHQGAYAVCLPPVVHSALLVQDVSTTCQGACVEIVPHLAVDDPLRHHMELALQAAFEAEGVTGRLYAKSLADALAVHFLRRYAARGFLAPAVPHGLLPAKLRRATAYIEAHLEDTLPLATLAAVVHLSPNHFASLFKRATGRTPRHYVLECRIARAKHLLAETELPLIAIGPKIGCPDQSYFTALFRKHVAMTPKAYRDATHRM